MVSISKLKEELLAGHPVTGAYSDDSAAAAAQINEPNRSRDIASLTGSQVMQAINIGEFNALSDSAKRTVWDVLHIGTLNPFGIEATLFIGAFGGGSATIAALKVIRKEPVSRAIEQGIGRVRAGDVQRARAE